MTADAERAVVRRRMAELFDALWEDRGDLPFFLSFVASTGSPVLEACCGTGRVLLPLVRQGHRVHGLDISPDRLAVCEARLRDEPPEVRARARTTLGDMRSFDLSERFQAIVTPFRSFQLLTTAEDQRAALRCFRKHIRDDGRLVIDIFNPSVHILADARTLTEDRVLLSKVAPDGTKLTIRERVLARDLFLQTQDTEEVIYAEYPDGSTERVASPFRTRYTFRYELEYLLRLEGFEIERLDSDFAGSPFGAKYPGELVVVARPV